MQVAGLDSRAVLKAAAPALFRVPVGVAVTDPRGPLANLYQTETDYIACAVAGRQCEFAAGRTAARDAMRQLGQPPCAIPAGSDRAPIWPAGLTGSISHTKSLCVAVVTRDAASIGIDLEEATPLDPQLIPTICTMDEQAQIAGADMALRAKLVFSAKEAAYKAQYPLTKALFGFDHFAVALNLERQTFKATFQMDVGRFKEGHVLQGRFVDVAGHFVTAVTLPLDEYEGWI
jgi:4'-phosphopantetheinyl transferase EntD